MKRRIYAVLLSAMMVFSLLLASFAAGGSSADPVVTKSYVDGEFFESVISNALERAESAASALKSKYINRESGYVNVGMAEEELVSATASAVLRELQGRGKYLYGTRRMTEKAFSSGDVITAKNGTTIMLLSGSATCRSGKVINLVQGRELTEGNGLGRYTAFMFTEDGASVEITSATARVQIDGLYSQSGYRVEYMNEAYELKKLGLVRGAANGMEMSRGNTRAESITMLVRLLGEEDPALAAAHKHPFTDVDAWAQKYVGYAYRMGYTKGVTANRYDGSALTTANQYVTFVLRALGYSEEAGDFAYSNAVNDAARLGVIPQSLAAELSKKAFRRDDVMHISYLAMSARVKGSGRTLLAKLVANGAVSSGAANSFLG